MSWPSTSISPPLGVVKPAIIIRVVVLPEPDGPSNVTNSPATDLQVDPVHRDRAAEGLAQVSQDERWLLGRHEAGA